MQPNSSVLSLAFVGLFIALVSCTIFEANSSISFAPNRWIPKPLTSWEWQLQGTINTSWPVQVYDIDLFDAPNATISSLKSKGIKVVCYFSAGSCEDWRPDYASFPASVKGNPMDGWAGERWLDIRNLAVLQPIMEHRMDLAVAKGCDGLEPDNVDAYDQSENVGFPITYHDQIVYNRMLATQAHARGLSVALKNDLGQIGDLVDDFDFAVNEQCFQYKECDVLAPFIKSNKAVFNCEYSGSAKVICPKALAVQLSTILKTFDLDGTGTACPV
eukprot:TRINITY_DN3058_c0_g1_i1.p1 TRINITY_DN3058_c0_g1~~TRINITY_DN3058_c0_g1_i1.p1  ORF type:complete len:303 (+),score=59.17 TRINITY_DN3058_c0_g1_i1:93-911(+)